MTLAAYIKEWANTNKRDEVLARVRCNPHKCYQILHTGEFTIWQRKILFDGLLNSYEYTVRFLSSNSCTYDDKRNILDKYSYALYFSYGIDTLRSTFGKLIQPQHFENIILNCIDNNQVGIFPYLLKIIRDFHFDPKSIEHLESLIMMGNLVGVKPE